MLYKNDTLVGQYGYCDSIKVDESIYECKRFDELNKIYEFTQGSLLTCTIGYADTFALMLRLDKIEHEILDDKIFEIPQNIPITNKKY